MTEIFASSIYFGLALSIGIYVMAVFVNKRWNVAITTPLLLTTIGIIAVLLLFDIPYANYQNGAKYLYYFLVPATVCFAVPMYKQINMLGKYKWAIVASLVFGCAVSIATVALLCWAFGLSDIIRNSLASVSVTTAIAIGITKELGGIAAITVFAVIITGILGNAIGKQVCSILGLRNPVARGLAIGNSSHAMGTAKALEMGSIEGATSSLAIVISGLATAILAPLILWLFG
ncbi:MAG: LrgB family protein [Alphaproteobacteria bacterium]|nr:LrgB family protein [Alphaproteobacteria bacterium]MCL2889808.1 LrgB family protein [Alphaproteobacteria bacterium]